MNKLLKGVAITFIIFFLSLYLSRYSDNYYENKKILTEKAISQYEKDLKEGKRSQVKDYIKEEKDYNNNASKIGKKASKFIETIFHNGLKYAMKYLEYLQDS